MKLEKQLREKMVDFQNFSYILLAVSTFFYLGILIRGNEVTPTNVSIIIVVTLLFISAAYFFRDRSIKCKNKLMEMEDNQNFYQH